MLGNPHHFLDFLYFFIGSFVGGGCVLNGSLYSGRTGNAGAVGSMPIAPVGAGGRGTRQQLIRTASIYVLQNRLVAAGRDASILWRSPADWGDDLGAILDDWIDEAAESLAVAIVASIAVIDFQGIVIDGAFPASVRRRLVEQVRAALAGFDLQGLSPVGNRRGHRRQRRPRHRRRLSAPPCKFRQGPRRSVQGNALESQPVIRSRRVGGDGGTMIVCCGEALIDFLPRPGPGGEALFQPFAGGSVLNVAVALGRLDTQTGFFSGLSTDFFGDMLMKALRDSKVDPGLAIVSDRPTTLAFVSLADGQARYAFFDEGTAGRMLTGSDLPALPLEVTALHFGSISLVGEPCGSTYESLMQQESPLRVISLDPNVRPSLIKNRDGFLARIERLVALADIVKLSSDDLEWMAPGADFQDFAAAWLKRGARLVILTRGVDGAEAVTRKRAVSIPGIAVKIADTIGAGDTFSAGVLARLEARRLLAKKTISDLSEEDLTDVLTYANRAASITVSRPGADPPWLAEMGD